MVLGSCILQRGPSIQSTASFFISYLQRTGWSALHFSAERGNSATTEALLKAGANAQLKDNVGLWINNNIITYLSSSISLSLSLSLSLFLSFSLSLVKSGLTALEIAEVKAAEKESYLFICNGPDYTSLISLLKENIAKESLTLPSQQVSV